MSLPRTPPKKPHGTLRIAFLGTSQTFGEGAELVGDSFVARIHHDIQRRLPRGKALETYNMAVRGWSARRLANDYLHEYLTARYDGGHLWWDVLQFSTLGHELAADWLAPRLAPLVIPSR